jgi:serine/threonine-protein kinase
MSGMKSNLGLRVALMGAALLAIVSAPSAAADDTWGAIALSQSSGAIGYSYRHAYEDDAGYDAVNRCSAHARDCKVVVTFVNACGAVAYGRGGGYGVAWNANAKAAQRRAMAECQARTRQCRILRWQCSN